MTATVDGLAAHREISEIAARRPDVIRAREAAIAQHPATVSKQCPPHAAQLHRLASLITTEQLPPAHLNINGRDILVDLTGTDLVENGVRRWAAALDLLVTEVATDKNGAAGTLWSASGWDGTNTWWHVAGALPLSAVTS